MPLPRVLPVVLFYLVLALLIPRTDAVFINFESCSSKLILDGGIPYLQFTPMYVWAAFDTHQPTHNLNVTVYGNVSGQSVGGTLPPPGNASWDDPKGALIGKIINLDPTSNLYTTLFSNFKTLTYSSWTPIGVPLCWHTLNQTAASYCPIGPAFEANASDPTTLPAFSVSHDFHNTYAFSTWATELKIVSGDTLSLIHI